MFHTPTYYFDYRTDVDVVEEYLSDQSRPSSKILLQAGLFSKGAHLEEETGLEKYLRWAGGSSTYRSGNHCRSGENFILSF
jgi:hypothetical protein